MRREAHFVHDEIFKDGEWSDQLVYAILHNEKVRPEVHRARWQG